MPDTEIELERVYNVPLSRAWISPRHRRVVRAVNILREFAERHMKSEEIKIDSQVNETLWNRGITKPPRMISVRMIKDEDGLVTISLPKTEKEEEAELQETETTPDLTLPTKESETKKKETKAEPSTNVSEIESKKEEKAEEKQSTRKKKAVKTKASVKKKSIKKRSDSDKK
jgi:large subunit ribosomal protein L31e